jgi:membrane-bound lytic murein transglycosylase A
MGFSRSIPPLVPSPWTAAQRRDPGSIIGEGAKRRNGSRLKAGMTGEKWQGLRCSILASVILLAACAPTEEASPPHLMELSQLPGWEADHTTAAFPGLLASCHSPSSPWSGQPVSFDYSSPEWTELCKALDDWGRGLSAARSSNIGPRADLNVRPWEILETQFVALDPGAGTSALVTGYYEPELDGSWVKDAPHPYPLYGLPPDPTKFDRAQIDGGALKGKKLELLWVSDRVEAFFLQVQGSGRVRLSNGKVVRVGFAGTNERPYVSVGKAMVDAGIMTKEQASLQSIRVYLNAHPDDIDSWLHKNPRYVFFKEQTSDGKTGPIGALQVPLTPGRSIAVDPAFVPLGLPVWLDTTQPVTNAPLQRLVVAQDKGSAIKGPGRIDLFWGAGQEAEAMAGPMRQQGTYWVIVPRAVGERWRQQQAGS